MYIITDWSIPLSKIKHHTNQLVVTLFLLNTMVWLKLQKQIHFPKCQYLLTRVVYYQLLECYSATYENNKWNWLARVSNLFLHLCISLFVDLLYGIYTSFELTLPKNTPVANNPSPIPLYTKQTPYDIQDMECQVIFWWQNFPVNLWKWHPW